MPNCDWNRPCDCVDCRTTYECIACPHCNFQNTVRIVGSATWTQDKKGTTFADIAYPKQPSKDLTCFDCGGEIKNAPYFDDLDSEACVRTKNRNDTIAAGRTCSKCKAVEGEFSSATTVALVMNAGALLCHGCLAETIKVNTPDPSTQTEKYSFDPKSMTWKVAKRKLACVQCKKPRWLNVENTWKSRCSSCFQAGPS